MRKEVHSTMGKRIENVEKLSGKYQVRRLTEADVDMVYMLSVGNPMFYQHCPPFYDPKEHFE